MSHKETWLWLLGGHSLGLVMSIVEGKSSRSQVRQVHHGEGPEKDPEEGL